MNEPTSGITHLIATLLSIAGLIVLVSFAAIYGKTLHVVTFAIFGASMILLYLASTIYHFIYHTHWSKAVFQKIDRSMIYLLIAGTYTPVTLLVLPTGWGWSLFGIIWGLAIIGTIIRLSSIKKRGWFSAVFYILMGWLILIAFVPLKESLQFAGLFWLALGGLFYTIGTIFFAFDSIVTRTKWFGMHELFHLFVMAGTFSHFWLMLKYVLPIV